jgi:hypothetical protein
LKTKRSVFLSKRTDEGWKSPQLSNNEVNFGDGEKCWKIHLKYYSIVKW